MTAYKACLSLALVALSSISSIGGTARADEWKEYSSPEGRFTVDLPGAPKQSKEKRQTKFGSVDAQLVIYSGGKDIFYGIAYLDYPESVVKAHRADELLDGASDSAVKGVKGGRVEGQEKISLGGNPGRQVIIDAPGNLTLTVRMYMVKNRLYQVISSVGKGKEKEADPKRFLDSFKFAG
jgi:hypothetical protein